MPVSMLSSDLNVFKIIKVETHVKKIKGKKKQKKKYIVIEHVIHLYVLSRMMTLMYEVRCH